MNYFESIIILSYYFSFDWSGGEATGGGGGYSQIRKSRPATEDKNCKLRVNIHFRYKIRYNIIILRSKLRPAVEAIFKSYYFHDSNIWPFACADSVDGDYVRYNNNNNITYCYSIIIFYFFESDIDKTRRKYSQPDLFPATECDNLLITQAYRLAGYTICLNSVVVSGPPPFPLLSNHFGFRLRID